MKLAWLGLLALKIAAASQPLSNNGRIAITNLQQCAKAVSPLRFATALQDASADQEGSGSDDEQHRNIIMRN